MPLANPSYKRQCTLRPGRRSPAGCHSPAHYSSPFWPVWGRSDEALAERPGRIIIIRPTMDKSVSISMIYPLISSSFTNLFRPDTWCGDSRTTLFVVRLATIRNGSRHRLATNAHIVSPSKVAVMILLSGQSGWVHKRSIDLLLVRGPSAFRPGMRPVARLPLHVWIGNAAMASTPQDTGRTGESNPSLYGISIIELTGL